MIILGAGLTGLLCGALNPGSLIYEAGPKRPNEHKAVLRMRSDSISRILGIPFKKVTVHKALWYDGEERQATPRFAHMYSKKISDTISARSIFNLASEERFIPPANFASLLEERCKIEYDSPIISLGFNVPVVSTIPMPALAKITDNNSLSSEEFWHESIYVNQWEIECCNSYCTIYFPDPKMSTYRATINGSTLIIESQSEINQWEFAIVCESLGITDAVCNQTIENHVQKYGKIKDIDWHKRRQFIADQTIQNHIYSLGRFATWRPKVMMDDVLEDIFVIRRLIEEGHYASINHQQGEK